MALRFSDVFKSLNVAYGIDNENNENISDNASANHVENVSKSNENISDNDSANHVENVSKSTTGNSSSKVFTNLDNLSGKNDQHVDIITGEVREENEELNVVSYNQFCEQLQNDDLINLITNTSHCSFTALLEESIDFEINSSKNLIRQDETKVVESNEGDVSVGNILDSTYVVQKEVEVASVPKEKKKKIVIPEEKLSRDKDKHKMQSSCKCTKECIKKIDEDARKRIHEEFWSLNYDQRATFIAHRMSPRNVQRRSKDRQGVRNRHETHKYSFMGKDGALVEVCQLFFLATLGFRSNRILLTVSQKCRDGVLTSGDQRGKSTPSNKFSEKKMEDILAHILSYDPRKPHYRENHAPKRLYLPAELSIAKMHKSYLETGENCSIETYRKEVARLNISFAKLGHEECEDCLEFDQHDCLQHKSKMANENKEQGEEGDGEEEREGDGTEAASVGQNESENDKTDSCSICEFHSVHVEKAKESRIAYQEDALKVNTSLFAYYSVDLQKVTMLPHLPGVKTVAFTKRIIAFNETFAPLGDKKVVKTKTEKPTAITWHQGEGGRSAQEISSTYIRFISKPSNRDVENFVFWADNCSSQNKCWYLYSTLCNVVNSDLYSVINSITVKYFERGHSFMSADSYHHLVEKGIRDKKNVYDYHEYIDVLEVDGEVCIMKSEDFFDTPRGVSEHSKFTEGKPMLDAISVAKFQRGSSKLFWKGKFTDEFSSSEFLQKKIATKVLTGDFKIPKLYTAGAPGVAASRKNGIIKNLLPVIPENRRKFWLDLNVAPGLEERSDDEDEAPKESSKRKRSNNGQSQGRKSKMTK